MSTFKKSLVAAAVAVAVGVTAAPAFAMKSKNNVPGQSALDSVVSFVESGNRNGGVAPEQALGGGNGRQTGGSTIPRSDYLAPFPGAR